MIPCWSGYAEAGYLYKKMHICNGEDGLLVKMTRDGYRARSHSFLDGRVASLLGGEVIVDDSVDDNTATDVVGEAACGST